MCKPIDAHWMISNEHKNTHHDVTRNHNCFFSFKGMSKIGCFLGIAHDGPAPPGRAPSVWSLEALTYGEVTAGATAGEVAAAPGVTTAPPPDFDKG